MSDLPTEKQRVMTQFVGTSVDGVQPLDEAAAEDINTKRSLLLRSTQPVPVCSDTVKRCFKVLNVPLAGLWAKNHHLKDSDRTSAAESHES